MPRGAGGNDDPDGVVVDAHREAPLARLDTLDGLVEAEFPAGAVWVDTTDELDALVRSHAVGLIDALNADVVCHWITWGWSDLPDQTLEGRCCTAAPKGYNRGLYADRRLKVALVQKARITAR